MIRIMKTYNSPMLQVVSISKKDIIVTSLEVYNTAGNGLRGDAPGMRIFDLDDSWDAGY